MEGEFLRLAALQQSGLLVCPEKMHQPHGEPRSGYSSKVSFLAFMARKQACEQRKQKLRNIQLWFVSNTFLMEGKRDKALLLRSCAKLA